MDGIISIVVALVILFLVIKLFSLSFMLFWNGVIGALALWVLNLLGAGFQITIFTSLIAGIFGIPGIIVLYFLK